MKIYLVTWPDGGGWDTYSDVVVVAKSPKDAKTIHPNDYCVDPDEKWWEANDISSSWANSLNDLEVQCIGTASPKLKRGVILASFHAG